MIPSSHFLPFAMNVPWRKSKFHLTEQHSKQRQIGRTKQFCQYQQLDDVRAIGRMRPPFDKLCTKVEKLSFLFLNLVNPFTVKPVEMT